MIDPDFQETWSGKAFVYYKTGDVEKAIQIYKKVIDHPAFRHKSLGGLGYLYAKNKETDKSLKFLNQLEEMETPDLPLDVEKAMIFTGLENFDKAFAQLNSAVDKKLGGMNFIKSKYWRDLHDDQRYIEILKRMNLPLD